MLVVTHSKYNNNKKFDLNVVSRSSIELSNEAHKLYFDLFNRQESLIAEFKRKISNSSSKEELIMAKHTYRVGVLHEYSSCIENIIALVEKDLSSGEKEKKAKAAIKKNYSDYIKSISNVQRIWDDGFVSMINKSDSYIRNTIEQIDKIYNAGFSNTTWSNRMLSIMLLSFIDETRVLKEFNEKLKTFVDRMNFNRIFRE